MWAQLVKDSLLRPREAARRILAAGVPAAVSMEAAVLVTCAGVVLGYLALMVDRDAIDVVSASILGRPLLGALVQLAALAVVVVLTVRIGRLFGGVGGHADALALVVWLSAVMVLVQVVQLVALAVLPLLAAAIAIATILWAFWAFASFVAELHGFRRPAIVLGVVILTGIVLFFSTAMLLAILGITPQETS
ncbi:MAG TPA: YIP1 family protein [Acetobacteraceae bacterium]|nr:YIP1 family protein [Acetobacteraceae bacterium]